MKLKDNKIDWVNVYLQSLESETTLTSDDLLVPHPLHDTFHRKAPEGRIEDIGKARGVEYTKKHNREAQTWSIDMNTPNQGMSCSSTCDNHNYANGGVYPIELIEKNLPEGSVVRKGALVYISGVECEVVRCYYRKIVPLKKHNITVGDARDKNGKDDLLLIDREMNEKKCSFTCYWDSKVHATICLREKVTVGYGSINTKLVVTFDDFNIRSWALCEKYHGVRVSDAVLLAAAEDRNFYDSISNFDKDVRFVLNALMRSFVMVSIETFDESNKIDDSISTLYEAKSFDKLTAEQKINICGTIDKYEDDIFDWETNEWSTFIRAQYFEGRLTNDQQQLNSLIQTLLLF